MYVGPGLVLSIQISIFADIFHRDSLEETTKNGLMMTKYVLRILLIISQILLSTDFFSITLLCLLEKKNLFSQSDDDFNKEKLSFQAGREI